jgi:hypothetical protein
METTALMTTLVADPPKKNNSSAKKFLTARRGVFMISLDSFIE